VGGFSEAIELGRDMPNVDKLFNNRLVRQAACLTITIVYIEFPL
jgi:hypothetical protein